MNVLFVCLGNICRSPTAEAVLRKLTLEQAFDVNIDSAGTAAYHIGKAPDSRSQAAAKLRGIDMSGLKARQANADDFYEFDYIFAMDESNYQDLLVIKPSNASAKLILFLKEYGTLGINNVPDPYYGGDQGFEEVLNLLEDACQEWINRSHNK